MQLLLLRKITKKPWPLKSRDLRDKENVVTMHFLVRKLLGPFLAQSQLCYYYIVDDSQSRRRRHAAAKKLTTCSKTVCCPGNTNVDAPLYCWPLQQFFTKMELFFKTKIKQKLFFCDKVYHTNTRIFNAILKLFFLRPDILFIGRKISNLISLQLQFLGQKQNYNTQLMRSYDEGGEGYCAV